MTRTNGANQPRRPAAALTGGVQCRQRAH
jgi:hypothetical protein